MKGSALHASQRENADIPMEFVIRTFIRNMFSSPVDLPHNGYYPSWISSTADTLHHGSRQILFIIFFGIPAIASCISQPWRTIIHHPSQQDKTGQYHLIGFMSSREEGRKRAFSSIINKKILYKAASNQIFSFETLTILLICNIIIMERK